MRYCNGTVWVDLGDAGGDGSGATNPIRVQTNRVLSSVTDAEIVGDYIFAVANAGSALVIIDVSTADAPSITSVLQDADILRLPSAIVVDGNYAYIGTRGNYDLVVVDISDKAAPSIVANIDHDDSMPLGGNDIAKSGDYVFVTASGSRGFFIFDVSTPTAPTARASMNSPGSVWNSGGIAASGNYVYMKGSGANLVVLDVSDPDAPAVDNVLSGPNISSRLTMNGNYIYAVSANSDLVYSIDISTPTAVTLADSVSAILGGSNSRIFILGNYLYYAEVNRFASIDISDPTNMGAPSYYTSSPRRFGRAVVAKGSYVYALGNNFYIMDVTTPTAPTFDSVFMPEELCAGPYDRFFYCVENERDVSTSRKLTVWDYDDPLNPVERGTLSVVTSSTSATLSDLDYEDGYLYLPMGNGSPRLSVVDVSDPDSPSLAGTLSSFGSGNPVSGGGEVQAQGDYLYNTGGQYFVVTDISNKASISVLATIDANVPGTERMDGLIVSGEYAYIGSEREETFVIVDIADPSAPAVRSTTAFARVGRRPDMAIKDNVVFLQARELTPSSNYITSIDVSDPDSPVILDEVVRSGGFTESMVINGDYLYSNGSLSIIDVSDPSNMSEVASFSDSILNYSGISFGGNYAYVSNERGVSVIDVGTTYGAGSGASTCTEPDGVLGSMHFDYVSYTMRFCNGSRWEKMGADGNGGAGCSTPTGVAGTMYYDSGSNVYRYCEGDAWITVN